jgi:hypothetical protein
MLLSYIFPSLKCGELNAKDFGVSKKKIGFVDQQLVSGLGCFIVDVYTLHTHTHTHTHTQTHKHKHINTHCRTCLNEWSPRGRSRYLYNTQQKQETNLLAASGIRTAITAIRRPQTYPLDRTATQTGDIFIVRQYNSYIMLLGICINIYMHAKLHMPN